MEDSKTESLANGKDMEKKMVVNILYYSSPCGRLVLGANDTSLLLCDWGDMPCFGRNMRRLERLVGAEFREASNGILEQTVRKLDEYFAGRRRSFDIPLLPVGTEFQKRVWQALMGIPYGETRTYMEIAQGVGNPKGVRAVAQAIGANGISIIVPCHRVIGSGNKLTGFAGGLEAKRMLLELEG